MANMPHKSKRAVTMRLDREWVEHVQEFAKARGETMTDLVVRVVSSEVGQAPVVPAAHDRT